MTEKTAPKTTWHAIARALRSVGLIQGTDFRVTGQYVNGERRYTFAYALTLAAERVMAENADAIETATEDMNMPFKVSVRYFDGRDQPCVRVDNGPLPRVRETVPASTPEPADAPVAPTPRPPVAEAATAPAGNVNITLPAGYAARAVVDLLKLRHGDPAMERWTPAMHVLVSRLEAALAKAAPTPESVALDSIRRRGDYADPCETFGAPAPVDIVTRVEDLVPTERYALWACDATLGACVTGRCSGKSMRLTGTGREMILHMPFTRHCHAERLSD